MSDKELLLLSNYVYMDASVDQMSIGDSLKRFQNAQGGYDADSVAAAGIGGGMNREEAADLFTEMNQMDEEFLNLYPAQILDEGNVRGICYRGNSAEEGTVIFRGTGDSYSAWEDNVLGECLVDTSIQKRAAEFVRTDCDGYKSINVSGHSKGGNLAMYTAVMEHERVNRCVSFDGQGFSTAFLQSYSDEINEARSKITSISAYNDFVNILLTSIAGTTLYAQNSENGINAHSSYYLYHCNDFDAEGNIMSTKRQSLLIKGLKEVCDAATLSMDLVPGKGNEKIGALLGSILAAVMSDEKDENYERKQIEKSALNMLELTDGPTVIKERFEMQKDVFAGVSELLSENRNRMMNLQERILLLQQDLRREDTMYYYVNQNIEQISEKLQRQQEYIRLYTDTLTDIGNMYRDKELALSELALQESCS